MPNLNQKIKLTQLFIDIDIETLDIPPAPKFLLRCMKAIPKDENGGFVYGDLLSFMKKNFKNEELYNGSRGITILSNIDRYWSYAISESHGARIPDFSNYFSYY